MSAGILREAATAIRADHGEGFEFMLAVADLLDLVATRHQREDRGSRATPEVWCAHDDTWWPCDHVTKALAAADAYLGRPHDHAVEPSRRDPPGRLPRGRPDDQVRARHPGAPRARVGDGVMSAAETAAALREMADDGPLLWEVARRAIEDTLIEWRDSRMFVLRNNGFVVKEADGTDSHIIRFGPEVGVRIALLALADHLDPAAAASLRPTRDSATTGAGES